MSPADDQPTAWEIVRRLGELEADHKDLARHHAEDIRDVNLRITAAKESGDHKFVRKDTHAETHRADAAIVADLHGDLAETKAKQRDDAGFRRQVLLGLSLAAISSFTAIAIAVFTLLARSS